MDSALLIIAVPVFFILGYGVYIFNRLVKQRNMLHEAWSGIDVQLKRRHELVPSLVEIVKGYAQHEMETLQSVTALRGQAGGDDRAAQQQAENSVSHGLRQIIALAEQYPELKANTRFADLHKTLIEVEDALQFARRYYNGTARDLNYLVESFPANIVASTVGVQRAEFFEIELASERSLPEVKLS